MVSVTALSYLVAGFVGSVILVYFVLKSTHALKLLATPGVPSVHGPSTVTAGGLGFAIPVIVYLSLLAGDGLAWAGGLLMGCLTLAAVGLWGDLQGSSTSLRFGCQIFAVAVVLWFMEPRSADSPWHWFVTAGVGVAVLWHVNLFNSMDGIDGIAAVHCLLFCTGIQVLTLGIPGWVGGLTWLLAGAVLGFLVYNWPPAKIVMGNVGSGLLGLLLAVITLQLWRSELLPLVACLILLAGFWFDATYTLCVRMFNGYSFSNSFGKEKASRDHLYQKVAESRGQVWTNVAYVIFAICWLLPLSWLTLLYSQLDLLWLVLAVLPMGIAARIMNAGMPAPDEG